MRIIAILISAVVLMTACKNEKRLPILGERDIQNGDTIYHSVPDFSFVNQDSQVVNNATFDSKIYVVDFFFISCPTICPKVMKQMLRVYEKFENEERLMLLSHTIGRLKMYAQNLGVNTQKWHFVTGDKAEIYDIADDYFSIAKEDPASPGGFDHSGRLILVDTKRHVRSFCDGTPPASIAKFMDDIKTLLDEYDKPG